MFRQPPKHTRQWLEKIDEKMAFERERRNKSQFLKNDEKIFETDIDIEQPASR